MAGGIRISGVSFPRSVLHHADPRSTVSQRVVARDAAARFQWNAELVHDYVLFMANTGRRPDEAKNLQHRHVTVVQDRDTEERILEIEVRPSASARA